MEIPKTLQKLAVPVSGLRPYERNPRRGELELIKQSLQIHGQYRPIVVRSGTNEILAGNHTYMAACELGWEKVAATFVECDDDQAARIVLVDNRASDASRYDAKKLAALLEELPEYDGTGWSDDQAMSIIADVAAMEVPVLPRERGHNGAPMQPCVIWGTKQFYLTPDEHERLTAAVEFYKQTAPEGEGFFTWLLSGRVGMEDAA